MSKEIIVNVGDRETRIAVLENSRLSELQIERGERIVGSLYKGRVENVLPGMDAAFLDIGLGRNAFLHVGDLLPGAASSSRGHERASSPDDDDDSDGSKEPSNDKKRLLRRSHRKQQHITDLLKRGQEVVVQVTKGPRGSKGARVSTLVSLPGRYLVLMPEAESVGVSRAGTGRYVVEIARPDASAASAVPISGRVTVRVLGERRTFPFTLVGQRLVLGHGVIRTESRMVSATW
ncbi:MAG: hypothetical protein HUU17_08315 [Chthonomonadales bacterium]|nr:hypothetical protein [Chthonomonadales bacterium]